MEWRTEIKQVFLRRAVADYESPSGVAVLTQSNGIVSVELLKADNFTKQDKLQIEAKIRELWPNSELRYRRFKQVNINRQL